MMLGFHTSSDLDRIERHMLALIGDLRDLHSVDTSGIKNDLKRLERAAEALNVRTESFLTETRYEERHEQLDTRVDRLEKWQANLAGRAIAFAVIGSLLLASISAFLTHLLSS